MLTRAIPNTNESLPVIGLGSYQTFDVGEGSAAEAEPRAVIEAFMESGGTLIDSSPMYGSSEAVVGNCLSSLKQSERGFIATKVWTSGREAGLRQIAESARKLRAPRIDLMQVHNLLDVDTHLASLSELKRAGRIRYIGVTHYTASAHAAVEKVMRSHTLDFIQINYSLAERDAEQRLLPLAAERGIAVIANRPFAGGGLLKKLQKRPLPPWAAEIHCNSWAQLALKFIVSHPAITSVIPATARSDHLRDYARAGFGRLPDAAMRERIAAAAL
jgi:diketogulonate reductase-like aldo/keto reductase